MANNNSLNYDTNLFPKVIEISLDSKPKIPLFIYPKQGYNGLHSVCYLSLISHLEPNNINRRCM